MFKGLRVPRSRWLVHTLIVGTVLVMACGWVGGNPPTPTPAPTAAPAASPSPEAAGESYTVAEGDTLATIAEKFYGDSALWRRIYDANRSTIGDNPDSVRIGTTLRIPPQP